MYVAQCALNALRRLESPFYSSNLIYLNELKMKFALLIFSLYFFQPVPSTWDWEIYLWCFEQLLFLNVRAHVQDGFQWKQQCIRILDILLLF